jgi:ADP-ribosylation factor GTPase-activating protein 2/3
MYFGRNEYDPSVVSEAQTRLQSFQGATSISSNQYFGREESEEGAMSGSEGGLLGDGSLAGLEIAARETIARVLSNPEVQSVGETIRSSALKVCLRRPIVH